MLSSHFWLDSGSVSTNSADDERHSCSAGGITGSIKHCRNSRPGRRKPNVELAGGRLSKAFCEEPDWSRLYGRIKIVRR
jgi:hypothetical protein